MFGVVVFGAADFECLRYGEQIERAVPLVPHRYVTVPEVQGRIPVGRRGGESHRRYARLCVDRLQAGGMLGNARAVA